VLAHQEAVGQRTSVHTQISKHVCMERVWLTRASCHASHITGHTPRTYDDGRKPHHATPLRENAESHASALVHPVHLKIRLDTLLCHECESRGRSGNRSKTTTTGAVRWFVLAYRVRTELIQGTDYGHGLHEPRRDHETKEPSEDEEYACQSQTRMCCAGCKAATPHAPTRQETTQVSVCSPAPRIP